MHCTHEDTYTECIACVRACEPYIRVLILWSPRHIFVLTYLEIWPLSFCTCLQDQRSFGSSWRSHPLIQRDEHEQQHFHIAFDNLSSSPNVSGSLILPLDYFLSIIGVSESVGNKQSKKLFVFGGSARFSCELVRFQMVITITKRYYVSVNSIKKHNSNNIRNQKLKKRKKHVD